MHEKRFSFFHEPSFMFMYCTLLLQEPNTNEMDIQFFFIPLFLTQLLKPFYIS
jgi:hypothetical protein